MVETASRDMKRNTILTGLCGQDISNADGTQPRISYKKLARFLYKILDCALSS